MIVRFKKANDEPIDELDVLHVVYDKYESVTPKSDFWECLNSFIDLPDFKFYMEDNHTLVVTVNTYKEAEKIKSLLSKVNLICVN